MRALKEPLRTLKEPSSLKGLKSALRALKGPSEPYKALKVLIRLFRAL